MTEDQHCYLFVYGLLRRGFPNAMSELLMKSAGFIGEGFVHGCLYDAGSYPALVVDIPNPKKVTGDLFLIKDKASLQVLDDFEGIGSAYAPPYEYERKHAKCFIDGSVLGCWIYEYQWPVEHLTEISSGDYRLYLHG